MHTKSFPLIPFPLKRRFLKKRRENARHLGWLLWISIGFFFLSYSWSFSKNSLWGLKGLFPFPSPYYAYSMKWVSQASMLKIAMICKTFNTLSILASTLYISFLSRLIPKVSISMPYVPSTASQDSTMPIPVLTSAPGGRTCSPQTSLRWSLQGNFCSLKPDTCLTCNARHVQQK